MSETYEIHWSRKEWLEDTKAHVKAAQLLIGAILENLPRDQVGEKWLLHHAQSHLVEVNKFLLGVGDEEEETEE